MHLIISSYVAVPFSYAQLDEESDPWRYLSWPIQDGKALIQGIGSERFLYLIAFGGGALAFAGYDDDLSDALQTEGSDVWHHGIRVVEELGNVKMVRPAAFMLVLGSLLSDNRKFQDAAITSLEAVVFANLITGGLKGVFGRARPFQERGQFDFVPFSGNTSFPSGHATTVFAFVTPWFFYQPSVFTAGLMVLGAGTAMSRVVKNAHWTSDIIVGSGIGFATAYWLTRRHIIGDTQIQLVPTLQDDNPGFRVTVNF